MKRFSEYSDKELFGFLQAGNNEALAELFHRYSDAFYKFFYGMLGNNSATAEDFVQELFIKILNAQHTYSSDYEVAPWMYSVAHNMVKNEYRKRSAQKNKNIKVDFSECSELNCNTDLIALTNNELFHKELSDLLLHLPEERRDLFLMRNHLGMSVKELSQSFEIPEGTVKSRLYHTTKWIAQQLKHYNDEL